MELFLQEMPLWNVQQTRNLLWESGIHSLLSQTTGLVKKHPPTWLLLLLGLTEERTKRVGAQEFLLGAQDASVLLLVGLIGIITELHKPVIFEVMLKPFSFQVLANLS